MATTDTEYAFSRSWIATAHETSRTMWLAEIDRLNNGGDVSNYSAEWLRGYTDAQGVLLEQLRDNQYERDTLIAGLTILLLFGGNGSEHNAGYQAALDDTVKDLMRKDDVLDA